MRTRRFAASRNSCTTLRVTQKDRSIQPLHLLANAHSKSAKHHAAMQAIFFAWYNLWSASPCAEKRPQRWGQLVTDHDGAIEVLIEGAAWHG